MPNTIDRITIQPSPTGVVVQTVLKAALKTFLQAFIAVLILVAIPELANWVDDVQNGTPVDIDFDFWTNLGLAALGAGIAALISFAMNYFGQTLPPNTVVQAEVTSQPPPVAS